ncbi:MAG: hypothetical protein ACE1ZS_11965, partial [Candidatus Poribacteria bacterium]
MKYFQKPSVVTVDSVVRYLIILLSLKIGFFAGGCDSNISQPLLAQSNLVLGAADDRFTINNIPAFLLGASYFDGRNYHESDLIALSAKGFNLIRVWLDWR